MFCISPLCRDAGTRGHLKNVYSALALTMLSAGVGAVGFFYVGATVSSYCYSIASLVNRLVGMFPMQCDD